MNNYQKYFGNPDLIARCRIENDFEEAEVCGAEEYIRVLCNDSDGNTEVCSFLGSWEFEEWLCSDLSYEDWRNKREQIELDS